MSFIRNHQIFFCAIGLFLLIFLSYGNSLGNGFAMDDYAMLVYKNETPLLELFQLDFAKLTGHSSEKSRVLYFRPLAHLVPWLETQMFGPSVVGYHLFNFLLFYLCSLILAATVYLISRDQALSWLSAGFFAVHPVNGVLVNYLTAAHYILIIIGLSVAVSAFLLGTRNRKGIYHGVSVLAFVVALLGHETALMFPLYLAALLYFVEKLSWRETLKRSIPFLLLAGVYLLARLKVASLVTSTVDSISFFQMDLWKYAGTLIALLAAYLDNLIFLKDIVLIRSSPLLEYHVPLLIAMFVFGLAGCCYLVKVWGRDIKSMALCWIGIGFLPLPLGALSRKNLGIIMEPHWFLFSAVGFVVLLSAAFVYLKNRWRRPLWVLLLAFQMIVFIVSSRYYNDYVWGDEKHHCRRMLAFNPEMRLVHYWLGCAYIRERQWDPAKAHFLRALGNTVEDWRVWLNLGFIEMNRDRWDLAKDYFNRSLRLNPDSPKAAYNLRLIEERESSVDRRP